MKNMAYYFHCPESGLRISINSINISINSIFDIYHFFFIWQSISYDNPELTSYNYELAPTVAILKILVQDVTVSYVYKVTRYVSTISKAFRLLISHK